MQTTNIIEFEIFNPCEGQREHCEQYYQNVKRQLGALGTAVYVDEICEGDAGASRFGSTMDSVLTVIFPPQENVAIEKEEISQTIDVPRNHSSRRISRTCTYEKEAVVSSVFVEYFADESQISLYVWERRQNVQLMEETVTTLAANIRQIPAPVAA